MIASVSLCHKNKLKKGSVSMQILKGAPVAAAIRDEIKKELEGCETKPCLAIVRVGEKQEDLPMREVPSSE